MSYLTSLSLAFFGLSGLIHVLFFLAESILFEKKHKKFGVTAEELSGVKVWAFNQGLYNLFLALGMFYAVYLLGSNQMEMGAALSTFCALFMIGAGGTLWISAVQLRKWAYVQFFPPLIGLILFHIS